MADRSAITDRDHFVENPATVRLEDLLIGDLVNGCNGGECWEFARRTLQTRTNLDLLPTLT